MTNPINLPDEFQLHRDTEEETVDPENLKLLQDSIESSESDDSEVSEDTLDDAELATDKSAEFAGFTSEDTKSTGSSSNPLLDELQGMTAEDLNKLAQENPQKALELAVTSVLHKQNIRSVSTEDLVGATRSVITVQQVRETIGQEFKPHKNTKLRDRAQEIYREKGFDIQKNPTAEFDAFVLAAHEHPEWLDEGDATVETHRNEPPTNGRRNSSSQSPATRLNSEDLAIAQRMGIDTSDGKAMKRLAGMKHHFQQRLRD